MKIKNKVQQIQGLPTIARVRILWAASVLIAVVLLGIWIFSSSRQIKNVNVDDINLTNQSINQQPTNQTKYITVEWVEKRDDKVLIFFKASNDTQSILNLSKIEDITLTVSGKDYKPQGVYNRQSEPFVVKVLSNTTNYGYLTFENIDLQSATLEFKTMFFENQSDIQFTEKYDLNLKAMNKPLELRG